MANLIRTSRTYKTADNAIKALDKALTTAGMNLHDERYLIAVAQDAAGLFTRFAPVLVGPKYIPFIHIGITVVG